MVIHPIGGICTMKQKTVQEEKAAGDPPFVFLILTLSLSQTIVIVTQKSTKNLHLFSIKYQIQIKSTYKHRPTAFARDLNVTKHNYGCSGWSLIYLEERERR